MIFLVNSIHKYIKMYLFAYTTVAKGIWSFKGSASLLEAMKLLEM